MRTLGPTLLRVAILCVSAAPSVAEPSNRIFFAANALCDSVGLWHKKKAADLSPLPCMHSLFQKKPFDKRLGHYGRRRLLLQGYFV